MTAGATGRLLAWMRVDLIDHHGAEWTLDDLSRGKDSVTPDAALPATIDAKNVFEAHDAEV